MNEHDLMDALEDHTADLAVGPVPLDAMTRGAARARRRAGVVGGIAAAAVVAVAAVGLVQVLPDNGGGEGGGGGGVAVQPDAVDVPPEGFVYVGSGPVAIAVPEAWAADDVECNGVPKASTYVVDPSSMACFMYTPFPADADAVTVGGPPADTTGWTPVEVDGAEGLRSPTSTEQPAKGLGAVAVSSASIFLPEQDVTFTVQSSVAPTRVDELLDGIVLLDGHVGVPGPADADLDAYHDLLEGLGLMVEVTGDLPSNPGITSVDPAPGTLVSPGATVTVTVAG